MAIEVRQWSAEEWLANPQRWRDLVARSGADRLFLSFEWLTTWWQHFGQPRGKLRMLVAYSDGELVGAAPMYLLGAHRRRLPVRSLQFVGTAWRDSSALISEYLDFIVVRGREAEIRAVLLERMHASADWSELLMGYTRAPESWPPAFARVPGVRNSYGRATEHCVSYQADLSQGFQSYLGSLGQSTRRSIWHLRRRLCAMGEVAHEPVRADELDAAFADLNRLHELRWGFPAFTEDRLRFHRSLAAQLAVHGELAMTRLRIGNRVVSMLYDLRKGDRQYNLKTAFDPQLERGYSLGLIHFGFEMERAAAAGVSCYDFLAGPGRRSDFKAHLAQRSEALATVQLLRGPLVANLFRLYDSMTGKKDVSHD